MYIPIELSKPRKGVLDSHFVKQHGANWERLGLELGLSKDDIAHISGYNEHHPRKLKMCYTAVLQQCFPNAAQDEVDYTIKKCRSLLLQSFHHTSMYPK